MLIQSKITLYCLLLFISSTVFSETIELKLGLVRSGGQQYFVELLKQSLEAKGHDVSINIIGSLPQKRIIRMLEDNELSLTWLLQSKERDKRYIPLELGITNGLIGNRVLLIPKGQNSVYAKVQNLEQFRALDKVGVFGSGWFDVDIWKFNQLKFIAKKRGWQKKVYNQIAEGSRGVDYFSRGVFEIVDEAKGHPYLDIEPHLLLIYDRDFRFYLSQSASHYKGLLVEALTEAKQNGLMTRLIREQWAESFNALNLEDRVQILLKTPPQ